MSEPPIAARAAIVHDWFQGFHGSERVVDAMLDLFAPLPDVLTFQATRELLPARLAGQIRAESRLATLPGIRQTGHDPGRWRYLLPYMPRYFSRLDVSAYDVVVSSSHACAVGVRPRGDALHLCYCYTPMRYVWLAETDGERVAGLKQVALRGLRGRLRRWDHAAAQRPDAYVAISTAVADRIARCYGRESEVVAPPVALGDFRADATKDPGAVLWVHRFVPYKRPLEVAAAFRELPDLRLTMVGVGPLADEVRRTAPPNVTVRGWTSREELAELYATHAAFVHVGEEDFGITMVEALAAGMPVLAYDGGGARDIVRDGVDGLRLPDVDRPGMLAEGLRELMARRWDPLALRRSAERFSEAAFRAGMTDVLRRHGASVRALASAPARPPAG